MERIAAGTGLGMAITRQLVRLHGGSINVQSSPGKGTRIRILLPLQDEQVQATLS